MKLHFLGTGAADWNGPDERGEHRRFTSTLIDGVLLIDTTMDTIPMIPDRDRVTDVLITHSHNDHFSEEALSALAPVRLFAHESWAREVCLPGVEVCPLTIGQWTQVGDFEVLPMPSNHSTGRACEITLHYLIRRDGKTFLYATDGGWLLDREIQMMSGMTLIGMAIDSTIGDGHEGDYRIFSHTSLQMVRILREGLCARNILTKETPVFLTHLARTLHPTQKELEESLSRPFIACHDGLEWVL